MSDPAPGGAGVPAKNRASGGSLSLAQLRALLGSLRLAIFVFADDRLAYRNASGVALAERLRQEYGIDLLVMLRDHLGGLRGASASPPPAVSLLTPPSGESFYVHTRTLPSRKGATFLAVSVRELGTEREAFRRRYGLSRRETQVVELLLRGYGNRDIAAALGIALGTAKKHLTRIFDKVGVDTRARLISRVA
jgi:DNA-binding CsgD family transcriptional regulator